MIINEQRCLNHLRFLNTKATIMISDAMKHDADLDEIGLLSILETQRIILDMIVSDDASVIMDQDYDDATLIIRETHCTGHGNCGSHNCNKEDTPTIKPEEYRFPNEHDPEAADDDLINDEELMTNQPPLEKDIIGGIFTGEFDELGEPVIRYSDELKE